MKIQFFLSIALTSLLIGQAWAAPTKVDLRRCMVGNQAGLLKVLTPNRKVAFTRGIDDRSMARMTEADRQALLGALGVGPNDMADVAAQLMRDYAKLPHKEAIAVLGALAGSPNLDKTTLDKMEPFLLQVMAKSPDVFARRQAILALAVLPQVQPGTIARVTAHYEKCKNLWETFPIQQFFEYHAAEVRQASDFHLLRSRLQAVQSLYTPAVLGYLDS